MGRRGLDSRVDLEPIRHDGADDRSGQLARRGIGLHLGQVALEHGARGALPEVRLEHRGEGFAPPGAKAPDPIGPLDPSPRRHRPAP